MPTTYTDKLRAALQATGENSNTWGAIVNANTIEMLEDGIAGIVSINLTGLTTYSLTTANGTTDDARMAILKFTGTPSAGVTITVPTVSKVFVIYNTTSQILTFTTGAGATTTVSGLTQGIIFSDGSAVYSAVILDPDRWCGSSTGGANTFNITLPSVSSYTPGLVLRFNAHQASTGASVVNLNGLGNKDLVRPNGEIIRPGDITANGVVEIVYDGTSFEMQTTSGSGSLMAGLGTAALPSMTFAGDNNTGIYSPGADQIGQAVNGQATTLLTRNTSTLTSLTANDGFLKVNQPDTGNTNVAGVALQKNSVEKFKITTADDYSQIFQWNGTNLVQRVRYNNDGTTVFYDQTGTVAAMTINANGTITYGNTVPRIVAAAVVSMSGLTPTVSTQSNIASVTYTEPPGSPFDSYFTVTFTNALSDTNYMVNAESVSDGVVLNGGAFGSGGRSHAIYSKSTTGFVIRFFGQTGTYEFSTIRPTTPISFTVSRWSA